MTGLRLAAAGLVLRLGGDTIIDLPEINAEPGTLTVLTGPSGSGKSSLLYLLSGLLRPNAGSVVWGDTNLAALNESRRDRWRRETAGFIFQSFHLIEEMNPVDNVLLTAWFSAFSAADRRARAIELLDRLEVPHERKQVGLLSRGEQQRVAIARALLPDPKVIVADEPTASLDSAAGERVTRTFRDLAARDGRTVIVASHDPQLCEAATTILALDHGHRSSQPHPAVAQ